MVVWGNDVYDSPAASFTKCKCVNVNAYVYGLISLWVQQTSQCYTPGIWNSLLHGLISSGGEFSAFSAANAIHNSPIFVLPGTHHCWMGRGSMEWEVCPTLLHMISSGNRTPDLLILSPTPYPLGHKLPYFESHMLNKMCKGMAVIWWLQMGILTLKVLVTTIDAQWEGMGDVGSARYEPALLPPCPTIRVLCYSNWLIFRNSAL